MQTAEEIDNWLPLESNPEVMNEYAAKIGLNTEKYSFQDLVAFEEWAYEMIPQPILGVVFNFPIKPEHTSLNEQQEQLILSQGQQVSENLFYMKQYAHNACGSVAIVHLAVNLFKNYPVLLKQGSILEKFAQQVQGKTPQQSGNLFLQASELKLAHKQAVQQGQSVLCNEVNSHFIAFVLVDSNIYELDGGKNMPINHGESNSANFLADTAKILKTFFDRDPQEVSFATVVLAENPVD